MTDQFDPTDLSEKELLIQANQQLGDIRRLLMLLADDQDDDPAEPMYQCRICGEDVAESSREEHANAHNLPPGADYIHEFVKAESLTSEAE